MKKIFPFVIAIFLIVIIAGGYFAVKYIEKITPSKETVTAEEFFGVSDSEVLIVYNFEHQESKAIYVENETYVPVSWVNEHINERFYWDSNEKLLVYTLPEEILYADSSTVGSRGTPLIWVTDEECYVSLALISAYTNLSIDAFDTEECKRVYINDIKPEQDMADLKKDGKIRLKEDIKSPIVTKNPKGTSAQIIETSEKWYKVYTADGYTGYIQRRYCTEAYSKEVQNTYEEPVYTSISMEEPVCLVWHQVTVAEANDNLESLIANTKGVNVISPTWFSLSDNEGSYNSLASREYVDKAHAMGLKVWVLLDNLSSDVNTEILMARTSVREKLIKKLMSDMETYDIDGINIDIESIKEEAGVHYIQFIRELSVSCRKNNKVLSIDNYVPKAYNSFYNRREQGIVADYIIIMGYDEHYYGGDMGSVASYNYVKEGIADTLKIVPKEKTINAVPFYTRVWTVKDNTTTSQALGIARAMEWVDTNQVQLTWLLDIGQYYGEYESEEGRQYIWLEEERSMQLKMDLIKEYELAGVACWKLGLEPADIWDTVELK